IMRFRIERALLSGDLHPADLPATWNQFTQELLGIAPTTDREGCLQDIHWSFGGLGYFPTYTLGNLYSAQFMHAMKNHLGEEVIRESMRVGDYTDMKSWLTQQIYSQGRHYRADTLCERVTTQTLSVHPFVEYLTRKFTSA
ncbi:MAG: hypothetical protein LC104_18870, partial [Bacteroidales bacterium]|nr:hypothetical protein [Bacteroidales bacterium]